MVRCGSAPRQRRNRMPSDTVVCSESCVWSGVEPSLLEAGHPVQTLNEFCLLAFSLQPGPYGHLGWKYFIGSKGYGNLFRTPLVLRVNCVGTEWNRLFFVDCAVMLTILGAEALSCIFYIHLKYHIVFQMDFLTHVSKSLFYVENFVTCFFLWYSFQGVLDFIPFEK